MNTKGSNQNENDNKEIDVIEKVIYGSFLEDRIVDVKPVESSGKWETLLVKGQEMKKEPHLYNKIKRSYQVPLNGERKGGGVKIILDSNRRVLIEKYIKEFPNGMTQQEFFERELKLDLNPMLPKEDNFWRSDRRSRVTLTKKGTTLNLMIAFDMLKYLILMSETVRICPNYEERTNKQSYEFMIVSQGLVTSKKVQDAALRTKAYIAYGQLVSDKAQMIGFIKSLGRAIPATYTEDWLKAEILEQLENDNSRFLGIINDPLYKKRIFVQEAIEAGSIQRKSKSRYALENGTELGDLTGAINYIYDPEHQELKMSIASQIEMKNRI